MRIINRYSPHVSALITSPAIAYALNLSSTTATMFVTKATGGIISVSTPARNAKGDPHPGRRIIISPIAIQGAKESPSPILPIFALLSFCINTASPT